jgi:integrase
MARTTRRRLATGIYRDAAGIAVVAFVRGTRIERRYPANTYTLAELKQLRRTLGDERAAVLPAEPSRGTFAADVAAYLSKIAGTLAPASWRSRRSELQAWAEQLGHLPRHRITPEQLRAAMQAWQQPVDRPERRTAAGRRYKPRPWCAPSPKTIRNRVIALQALWHRLDGKRAATPADDLALPRPPKRKPRPVELATIRRTLARLIRQERAGRLRDAKTRARFMVLVTCGQRPVQVRGTTPADVDLAGRVWYVPAAKGGEPVELPLNDDMLAAWSLFAAAGAWGCYDSRSFARTLRAAGWPEGVRPYDARHTVGIALSRQGVDLGDIQPFLGHSSVETTRRFYVPGQFQRIQAAAATIDHRLGVAPRVLKYAGREAVATRSRGTRRGTPPQVPALVDVAPEG